MGIIPPRETKTIVAHADPLKHPRDIKKSVAMEVLTLEVFPTSQLTNKLSEVISVWKVRYSCFIYNTK